MRQESIPLLDPLSAKKLNDAEILLGIGSGLSEACRQELNTGTALLKTTIVMADPAIAPQFAPHFGANLVVIDPANRDRAEVSKEGFAGVGYVSSGTADLIRDAHGETACLGAIHSAETGQGPGAQAEWADTDAGS